MFNGACFYSKKGNYQIQLHIDYIDANTKQTANKAFNIKKIDIKSELTLKTTSNKKLDLSTNEYILGPLPAELNINADQIFRDL